MTVRSRLSRGLIYSGEDEYLIAGDRTWTQATATNRLPPAIYCHGAAGTVANVTLPVNGQLTWMERLSQDFTVLMMDFSSPTNWGNDASLTVMDSAISYLQTLTGVTKVALTGTSMGCLMALNYIKSRGTTNVRSLTGFTPALNLNDMYVNNRIGLAASIAAAYGGTYDASARGATKDPVVYGSTLDTDLPIKFWYSQYDTVCPPAQHVDFFKGVRPSTTMVEIGIAGHEGHSDETIVNAIPAALQHARLLV